LSKDGVRHPVKFIAVDLGAESGRTMLGTFDGERLALSEVLRFPNGPVRVLNNLHWDVLRLFDDIKRGLARAAREHGTGAASIGLDTWGVDFALLDGDGELLGNPFHYRDARTDGMMYEAFRVVPREQIFAQTGVQFMQLNSLYQLLALKLQNAPALTQAAKFLMMPDLFNYWLTGQKVCEFTTATTTQFYDPRARAWARPLLEALGLPVHILPELVAPGTPLGALHPSVAEEVGLRAKVIAPACHDTGSAVAAIPFEGDDCAWISSGTWSVLGANVSAPIINASSLAYNFTNEGGVDGTFRFSKNVTGLWLVQECRRAWTRGGAGPSYDTLVAMAQRAPAFGSLIDPDDDSFLCPGGASSPFGPAGEAASGDPHPALGLPGCGTAGSRVPGDMPARIAEYCRRTKQTIPDEKGALVRCVLEGLALKYRFQIERLEAVLGKKIETLHIAGGGAQNLLLCQFTANATGKRVIAGPVEATALGNVLMQGLALGHFASLAEGRQVIRNSFATTTYEPAEREKWDEAYGRFVGNENLWLNVNTR
jgi:rhamnulokinase